MNSKFNELPEDQRWAYHVLDMVRVLHEWGYERLRIMPGMAPNFFPTEDPRSPGSSSRSLDQAAPYLSSMIF